MMSAPSCASRTAWLRPWLRAAPVMKATLPCTRPGIDSSLVAPVAPIVRRAGGAGNEDHHPGRRLAAAEAPGRGVLLGHAAKRDDHPLVQNDPDHGRFPVTGAAGQVVPFLGYQCRGGVQAGDL